MLRQDVPEVFSKAKKAASSAWEFVKYNNRGSIPYDRRGYIEGGSYSPKNKTKLWGQEKYVTEKGLNTVKQHLSGKMEAAKAYYNAVEFNFYHPDVIMQYNREFSPAWFRFWDIEGN